MSTTPELSLFLDCSGPGVKVGLLNETAWLYYQHNSAPALEAVTAEVATLLQDTETQWSDIHEVFFCSGPGSQLSLRVGAISLQAWYVTTQLRLKTFALMPAAGCLLARQQRDFLLVAPARKGEWHRIQFLNGQPVSDASLVSTEQLDWNPEIPAYWIPHRELGGDLPDAFQRWHPDWSTTLLPFWAQHQLLAESQPQDLLSHQSVSSYTRWDGQIHQKPSLSK